MLVGELIVNKWLSAPGISLYRSHGTVVTGEIQRREYCSAAFECTEQCVCGRGGGGCGADAVFLK